MTHRRRGGFTLAEMAVVVAVLAVVLAIALPQFAKMYLVRNEAAVIEGLRAVVQACESWRSQGIMQGVPAGVPATLQLLVNAQPPYLDRRFAGAGRGSLFGYRWTYTLGAVRQQQVGNVNYLLWDRYTLRADPVQRGVTGQRSFFVDETGVVRFDPRGAAGPASTPIELVGD